MVSLDRLFDILSRERRRYALYALDQADEPMAVEELAERVRGWEKDTTELSAEGYENVVLALKHTHLPKAASAEYIEYDRSAGEIDISGEPPEFRIVLTVGEVVEGPDDVRPFEPDEVTARELLSRFSRGDLATD